MVDNLLSATWPTQTGRHLPGNSSPPLRHRAEVTMAADLSGDVRLYRLRLEDAPQQEAPFHFQPGQFIMLEVPGIGEAPFSLCSHPGNRQEIELAIRVAGNLTSFLARIRRGLQVSLDGPFGTSFPLQAMQGNNLLLLAGGLGIIPLRPALLSILGNRSRFSSVTLLYGTRTPSARLFIDEHRIWQAADIQMRTVVDQPDEEWRGATGSIASILEEEIVQDPTLAKSYYSIACGPPAMFKPLCDRLTAAGLPPHHIFVSLERRMHCGRGTCCRCNIGSTYTCQDGPVFDYWSVMNLKEAI